MIRRFLHLSLVIFITISAFARQQQRADENAPKVERLRAHVTHLASDKLEGRMTGSLGAELAAEYIAREFSRYGLKRSVGIDRPGMSILEADSPRRYMQEFPFVAGVELGKNNAMFFTPRGVPGASRASLQGARIAPLDLIPVEEWIPLGFSSSGRSGGSSVVFVGHGITASDLKHDDYAGVDVTGRIALALSGTPDGDNPHGEFARYADARWKAIAAREHGAAALVVIAREENFKDDPLSRLRYDNSAGDVGLHVVAISRQVASRILASGGIESSLAELEKAARAARSNASAATAGTETGPASGHSRRSMVAAPLPNVTLSIVTDVTRRNVQASNVVGILEGSDPKLKNEAIVIGAHYDHLGRGGEGSLAAREGEVHHGADDNASGVAGVLELARIFSNERARLKRTLIFIAFSGEEEGLLGSNYYVNHPVVPLAQTVAMINMDMIGRMKDGKLSIGGVGTSEQWRTIIEKANLPAGLSQAVASPVDKEEPRARSRPLALTLNEDGYGPSDHSSFYSKRVPVLFFWTGTHEDYHKPSDTADKINYEDEARIIAMVADVVRDVDERGSRLDYTTAKSESTRRSTFRVYLGTIPNYADANDGLTLDGVRDDSPASRAGLKAGDRIVRMAGRDVRNVYDYTYALGEMKAGEEYEVEIIRAGQTVKLKVTPASRK